MQVFKLDENKAAELKTLAAALNSEKLVIIPTETVYGLAADAFSLVAVKKVFEVKNRSKNNPLLVLISDFDMLKCLVEDLPEGAKRLMQEFWPGPLTLVLKKRKNLLRELTCGLDFVGVRMPGHPLALEVIRAAGKPLAVPSANISGGLSPTKVAHCIKDFEGRVEFAVDGGDCRVGVESTVLFAAQEPMVILRPGMVTKPQLEKVLGAKVLTREEVPEENGIRLWPKAEQKHYTPRAKVVLVAGDQWQFKDYLQANATPQDCAMIFEEEAGLPLPVRGFVYGRQEDASSLARGVFAVLRQVDEAGFGKVFVHLPRQTEENLAVLNRLNKAAGMQNWGQERG